MLGPLYELPPGGSKPTHQLAGHAHIAHFTKTVQSVQRTSATLIRGVMSWLHYAETQKFSVTLSTAEGSAVHDLPPNEFSRRTSNR